MGLPYPIFFFADDVLLFAKAKISQIRLIQGILNDFCSASGMKVNIAKSRAFAGPAVTRGKRERITCVTSIAFTSHLDRYLGFPILKGRQKKEDYNFIVDRVAKRLASWKGMLLSKAGKITLVKSVVTTIPIYPMQICWLPQFTCDRIDALARGFIWSHGAR